MKILPFIILNFSFLFANSLTYKVYAPLFGEVGEVKINYTLTSTKYEIKATTKTYGFAKKLSGNRVESYLAKGFIKNNIYHAKDFIQDVKYKNKKSFLEYIFNYKAKKIIKIRKKWIDNKLTTNYKKPLSYFTYNDLFTSYHNIVATLKNRASGVYKMQVAGMEKYGGYLIIKIPPKKIQQKEAKSMKVDNVWVFHIVTKKRILKSKSGEIIFAVGEDGIAKAVRVIDIPIVSHLDAKLIK